MDNKHTSDQRAARENTTLVLLFLLLGLGAGAGGALLFAPNPGQKTRDELVHAVGESLQSGRKTIEPALKHIQAEFAGLRRKADRRFAKIRLG
jgi:gas vesicle protein